MCNKTGIEFGRKNLALEDVQGKSVIEVGAYDVNGSLRFFVEDLKPASYLGVDIEMGPGVDEVCNAEDLIERFGQNAFDVLISTEMLEHVRNWRVVISNLKNVVKPGGILLLTTRSIGFRYHGYPYDFWRYELADMEAIFSDFKIDALESDALAPGVFLRAQKPDNFEEMDTSSYQLYSIVKRNRITDISDWDIMQFKIKRSIYSIKGMRYLKRLYKSVKSTQH